MVKFTVSAETPVRKGMNLFIKDHVYKVKNCWYYDSDGWIFGAMNDEWYDVEAECIDDTPEGKDILKTRKAAKEKIGKEKEKEDAILNIRRAIVKGENRYNGTIALDDIPGETIVNTFNVYGGGCIIKRDDKKVWVIMNNGWDGADCRENNVKTNGAGAVGFCGDADLVQKELEILNG